MEKYNIIFTLIFIEISVFISKSLLNNSLKDREYEKKISSEEKESKTPSSGKNSSSYSSFEIMYKVLANLNIVIELNTDIAFLNFSIIIISFFSIAGNM